MKDNRILSAYSLIFFLFSSLLCVSGAIRAQLSDPTKPVFSLKEPELLRQSKRSPPVQSMRVQSIVVSPQSRYAIIDGRIVREGDLFNGTKITKITPYSVQVRRGRRHEDLRLVPRIPVSRPPMRKNSP